jgi:epoxyqueuosine reductase QueG
MLLIHHELYAGGELDIVHSHLVQYISCDRGKAVDLKLEEIILDYWLSLDHAEENFFRDLHACVTVCSNQEISQFYSFAKQKTLLLHN